MKQVATHRMHVIASATKRNAEDKPCARAALRALSACCDKTVLAVTT